MTQSDFITLLKAELRRLGVILGQRDLFDFVAGLGPAMLADDDTARRSAVVLAKTIVDLEQVQVPPPARKAKKP